MAPPAPLPLIAALLLGLACSTQAYDQVAYCQGTCPDFTRVSVNSKYEERLYEASVWMCTEVASTSAGSVMAAHDRLKNFRDEQSQALGVTISDNTWPGLVSVKQVDGVEKYEMCWLVPPGVTLTGSNEVEVKTLPKATMFVRYFGGVPSIELGTENAQVLKADLEAAGESFDSTVHYGAGYNSYFSLTHHNEIWFLKT